MKRRKQTARDESSASKQSLSAAASVAFTIEAASRLSLTALTWRGRRAALRIIHLKASNAAVRFGQHLRVLSAHEHPRHGTELVLRFCGSEFVATFESLTEEAQAALAPVVARLRGDRLSLPRAA